MSQLLLEKADRYVDFINEVSSGQATHPLEKSKSLFAEDCRKVFNGHLFFKSREELVSDLVFLYKTKGGWNIHPVDTLVALDSRCVILRLKIALDKGGVYTAIKILRYNQDGLITEINEVFSPVQNEYDFN